VKKVVLPISKESFSNFSDFIDDVTSRNESGSIIGLSQREQIYRVNQFINQDSRLKKINIKVIDLNNYLLEDSEDFNLPDLRKNQKNVYLIINSDCLLEEKQSFLSFFNKLTKENPSLSLIFFFRRNITYPWTLKKISSYHYLFQNIYFYPAYNENDQKQFLLYLENKFKIVIPKKIKNLVCKECGGNLWFIKEAVRYLAKTNDVKGIFDHQEMNFRLKVVHDELEDREKDVAEKIVNGDQFFTDEEIAVVDYFKKMNFTVPILNKFIIKQTAKETSIAINKNNRITINSIIVDLYFSKKERAALRHFLSQKIEIVSREEIAKSIWGENNSYTDWALDQFIKRLRDKLKKLGLKVDLIKTVKNKGFFFNK